MNGSTVLSGHGAFFTHGSCRALAVSAGARVSEERFAEIAQLAALEAVAAWRREIVDPRPCVLA